MPIAILDSLRREPGDHRLLCADFAWCSFVVGEPRIPSFSTAGPTRIRPPCGTTFSTSCGCTTVWRARVAQRRINTVLVGRDSPLDQALERTPPGGRSSATRSFGFGCYPQPASDSERATSRSEGGRELFGARRIFPRVAGVARVGMVLGQPLEQVRCTRPLYISARAAYQVSGNSPERSSPLYSDSAAQ